MGIEPATYGLQNRCSTIELHRPGLRKYNTVKRHSVNNAMPCKRANQTQPETLPQLSLDYYLTSHYRKSSALNFRPATRKATLIEQAGEQ